MTAERRVAAFLAKIQKTPHCWLWTGARLPTGYGQFNAGRVDGRQIVLHSHVVMWRLANEGREVPRGLEVMHSCHVPWCVNPAHLSVGTHSENIRQATERGSYRRPRPGAWTFPRELVLQALQGPRGTTARLAREHQIPFPALAIAVYRARRAASHELQGAA